MTRFLKDKVSSVFSDLHEEILKPKKSHTNRITQIVSFKTALKSRIKKILMQKVVTTSQFTRS